MMLSYVQEFDPLSTPKRRSYMTPGNSHGILAKMSAAIVQEDTYTPISCVMFYDMNEPFEVVFSSAEGVAEPGDVVEWHYGRDLLKAAVDGEERALHGEGDVIISKEEQFVFTMLQSTEGRCLIAFALQDIKTFLDLTATYVPFGEEMMGDDVDAALRELLDEEG
jgi:hypothetical protein